MARASLDHVKWALLGAVAGALVPVGRNEPGQGAIAPLPRDAPPGAADLAERLRLWAVCSRAPVDSSADETLDRDAYQQAYRAFVDTWGAPISPPEGWDPELAESELQRRLATIPSSATRVDCSLWPCTAAIASVDAPLSRDEVAAALGVDPSLVALGSSLDPSSGSVVWTSGIALLPELPGSEAEQRWVERLRLRTEWALQPEIEAMVRDSGL